MNPLKSQVKIGTVNELGNQFDDMREAAEKDIFRKDGYHQAINDIQGKVLKSIFERVDADRDAEGEKDEGFDLETATLIKKYLMKVHNGLDNLRIHTEKQKLIAEGKVAAFDSVIQVSKKMMDTEKEKLRALQESMEAGAIVPDEEGGRIPQAGVRPHNSASEDIANRRAEAKATKASSPPTEASGSTKTTARQTNGASKKKARKRAVTNAQNG